MTSWNVIATANADRYAEAEELLADFGHVQATSYFNVLTLEVPDIPVFLEDFALLQRNFPHVQAVLSRVVPLTSMFTFSEPEAFLHACGAAVRGFAPALAGKRFHVRFHRRGYKGRIVTPEVERALDDLLRSEATGIGPEATISFTHWEAVVVVETIDSCGGASLWTVEQGQRYPFLKLD
jgi:hypothetical protein